MGYTVVSGMQLWLRRREDLPGWRGGSRVLSIVAWGLPLALVGRSYFYFFCQPDGGYHLLDVARISARLRVGNRLDDRDAKTDFGLNLGPVGMEHSHRSTCTVAYTLANRRSVMGRSLCRPRP